MSPPIVVVRRHRRRSLVPIPFLLTAFTAVVTPLSLAAVAAVGAVVVIEAFRCSPHVLSSPPSLSSLPSLSSSSSSSSSLWLPMSSSSRSRSQKCRSRSRLMNAYGDREGGLRAVFPPSKPPPPPLDPAIEAAISGVDLSSEYVPPPPAITIPIQAPATATAKAEATDASADYIPPPPVYISPPAPAAAVATASSRQRSPFHHMNDRRRAPSQGEFGRESLSSLAGRVPVVAPRSPLGGVESVYSVAPQEARAASIVDTAAAIAVAVAPQEAPQAESTAFPPIVPSSSLRREGDLQSSDVTFRHASLSDFAPSKLIPIPGPRPGAYDVVGEPFTRKKLLVADGRTSAGASHCNIGGWTSDIPRPNTNIFHVLSGKGCVTDSNGGDDHDALGTRHDFSKGDTVVLPKGWTGRWDVQEELHRVWFAHDHDDADTATPSVACDHGTKNKSEPIKAKVKPREGIAGFIDGDTATPVTDPTRGAPTVTSSILYDKGLVTAGGWTCTPGSFPVRCLETPIAFHVLDGVFFLTEDDPGDDPDDDFDEDLDDYIDDDEICTVFPSDERGGPARKCVPGDTVVLPRGWSGHWDVVETVSKLWTTLDG